MKNLPGEPGFRLQVSLLQCFWRLELTLAGAVDCRRRRRRRHGRRRQISDHLLEELKVQLVGP